MTRNIFVLGLDAHNHEVLRGLPDADRYVFHPLLTRQELQKGVVSVPRLLDEARRQLDSFDGSVDAIVGFWDFPVTLMVPILCRERGLPSADLKAVVTCEHKYWSRLEQQKVIDEYPAFDLLDVHDDEVTLPDGIRYPVWIKPIKSASSEGAHYAADDGQLRAAAALERTELARVGAPFRDVLAMIDLPARIADIGDSTCLIEEAASGRQATVEGYSLGGDVTVYGVVDSISYPDVPSFLRYQYPSTRVPPHVRDAMEDVSRRVISAIGLTRSTFNIEYFWDPDADRLTLLEINARHSQSHALLFSLVDGITNHAFMLDLALGRRPRRLTRGEGSFPTAAKWFLRRFQDGIVTRVPTSEEVAALERSIPGTTITIAVEEGERLWEAEWQDSFSCVLAEIVVAGRDEPELSDRYAQCIDALPFEFVERGEGA